MLATLDFSNTTRNVVGSMLTIIRHYRDLKVNLHTELGRKQDLIFDHCRRDMAQKYHKIHQRELGLRIELPQ